jgi:hypothetical protein
MGTRPFLCVARGEHGGTQTMYANRNERSDLGPLRLFAWAVGVGVVLYGIGMFGTTAIDRLASPFPVRENPKGPTLVISAKPAEPNSMTAPVYLPAQFAAEEGRAAISDPLKSF